MATKVRHGRRRLTQFSLCLEGNYTKKDGLAAAGVTAVHFKSRRAAKRQAELLAMRSAFVCYFVEEYVRLGGSFAAAVRALQRYPLRRIKRGFGKMGKPQAV